MYLLTIKEKFGIKQAKAQLGLFAKAKKSKENNLEPHQFQRSLKYLKFIQAIS
jgi:hypothetical protein